MQQRHVVIVAFDGVQPLDVVGPHEVFAGAGRAAASLGRAGGYRVTVASESGGAVRAESGLELGTTPLPRAPGRIDTLVLAGGTGADAAAEDEALVAWIRQAAPRCRRVATVCSGAFLGAAAGLLDGRRVTTHWARAGQLRAAFPARHRRPRPDLHPRREVLVQRRGHGRHRPLAGARPGGPRGRRGPDGGPLAGHVPAPARRPDPVRLAGVGPPRRALHRPGRPDARRGRPRW